MLWNAGQERMARERTARLAELFVSGRDAYVGAQVALGKAKTSGGEYRPGYLSGEAPRAPADAQRATLGRIARMVPGTVVRRSDA
jgi:hypothetical protein